MRTTARRLSSDWESTRLKIELSPVQIGEAAFSRELPREHRDRVVSGENAPESIRAWKSQPRNGERSEPHARNVFLCSNRGAGTFLGLCHC